MSRNHETEHHHTHQKIELASILSCVCGLLLLLYLPDGWQKIVIAIIIYLVAGFETLEDAVKRLIHGDWFDESLLMVVASVGAAALGEWTEAAAVMVFFSLGEWVQGMAEERSRKSISALLTVTPDTARVLRNGREEQVSPKDVKVGENCSLHPGDRVPLDGVITEGSSDLDTSALTGESLPRACSVGDVIQSGSVVLNGALTFRVTRPCAQSAAQRILYMVENATEKKAATETFITRFARVYTPCVVAAAALIAILPPILGGQDWNLWIHRGLMLLVVSCPCALVLSVPLTYFAGIGGASRAGILVKSAQALDTLSEVRMAAFDKTGTLTTGELKLDAIVPEKTVGISEAELLELAALAESSSEHPLAKAIRNACSVKYTQKVKEKVKEIRAFAGLGVQCQIGEDTMKAGNRKFIENAPDAGKTAVYLSRNGQYLGCLTFTDEPKAETREALESLKHCGIRKTVLLTGDVGAKALEDMPLDEIHAGLSPEGKCEAVRKLSETGKVCYVGDGINDAPVLAQSDVGIAMGAFGTDAAMEAADVVLVRDDPRDVAAAVLAGKRTVRIVRENILFALAVKILVMVLVLAGLANMWQAVFADVGVALICIANAARAFQIGKNAQKDLTSR